MADDTNFNTAPADDGGAVSEPVEAEPSTLDSVDDIVNALNDDSVDNAQDVQGNEAAPAEPETDNVQEQDATAEIPMPESFDSGVWGKMTPEARNAVHAMAENQAAAIAQERQTVIKERAERDAQINAASALLNQYSELLNAVANAEYAAVDWQTLSSQDPSEYIRLAKQYQERRNAIKQLGAQIKQTKQAVMAKRAQEYTQSLQNEFQTVEPKIRALVGNGYDGKQFSAELAGYLKENGVPDNVINGLSKGYELELVSKAMLFDKMAKARAAAAQKVADAPTVQTPSGVVENGDSVRKHAFAAFHKNPDSTDALAAALAAME